MRDRFFYGGAIAFVGGIGVGSALSLGWGGGLLCVLIGIALLIAWRIGSGESEEKRKEVSRLFLWGIILLSFGLGVTHISWSKNITSTLSPYEGESVELTSRIVREPEIRNTQIHLYVTPSDAAYEDEIVLVTLDRLAHVELDLSYGDEVRARGVLTKPEAFATDGGREFDYPGYLRARGVVYTLPFAAVTIVEEESGTFMGTLFRGKQKFMESIEASLQEPYAGLGEGVLLGVKRAIGEDLEEVFRETGIIHIVVLSGYNIMLVVAFVMFLLSFGFYPRTRLLVGLCAIALFALLVGLSATVVRASLMAGLFLIAQTTGNTYAVLRALTLAGVVMLLINPFLLLHDPGFQLSFLASLGLILFSPWIEKRFTHVPELWGLRNIGIATVTAQLFVLPLLLYQMGLLSLVSVVVNLLVLPMVPVAMLLTFITGLVGLVSSVGGMLVGFFAYLSLKYIIVVAQLFAALPFASVSVPAFPLWVMVLMYLVLGVVVARLLLRDDKQIIEETVMNDYEGWVIEEEKIEDRKYEIEDSRENIENKKDLLPFR